MVFGGFFSGRKTPNKEEGRRLFELGMKSAVEFNSNQALYYYAKSIEAYENPSPYINRANLLSKRIRYFEALQDLLRAQIVDKAQGKEFQAVLEFEIRKTQIVTSNYVNGTRQKMIDDLREKGSSFVAMRILCTCFDVPQIRWQDGYPDTTFIDYHLFNELDDIGKFDDINLYPEAAELVNDYPAGFFEMKVNNCPDLEKYQSIQLKMHNFLCSYEEADMVQIRRHMIYEMHNVLMRTEYGDFWDALSSDCEGLTKDAVAYRDAKLERKPEFLPDNKDNSGIKTSKRENTSDAKSLPDALSEFSFKIADQLPTIVSTEGDLWMFVVREYDRFQSNGDFKSLLKFFPLQIHEIECTWGRADPPLPNPGISYIRDQVIPVLSKRFDGNLVQLAVAHAFSQYCLVQLSVIQRVRLEFAVHFRNECNSNGQVSLSNQWNEVVHSLGGK